MIQDIETCFNYCDLKVAFFSSNERRWINKIHRLKEQNPEEVEIIREPEENDGCIYCRLPASWLKVSPPRTLNLSEEQRQEKSRRMRCWLDNRNLIENLSEQELTS